MHPWSTADKNLPIIAGKIGGLGHNDEFVTMQFDLGKRLNKRLCHQVRIAVLADSGESRVFNFGPESRSDRW